MEWESADSHAHSASSEGEYCLVEAYAVPFYLQQLFADRFGLFEVVTVPLRLLEIVLEGLQDWTMEQATATADAEEFRAYLHRREMIEQADEDTNPNRITGNFKAAVKLIDHLEECEVCVVPSVLLMSKAHMADEW